MLLITCPYCGPRDESEFSCGGEAHIARPLAENSLSDAAFADYLFLRDNPKGLFLERRQPAAWRRYSAAEAAAKPAGKAGRSRKGDAS